MFCCKRRTNAKSKSLGGSNQTACQPVEGYTTLTDVDYNGNDLGNFGTDIDNLRATCDQNPSCLGFNHNGWEKYAQPRLINSPGNCYYVKDLPVVESGAQCGPGRGRCPGEECCSQFNWCSGGSKGAEATPWCGRGCQPEYGKCNEQCTPHPHHPGCPAVPGYTTLTGVDYNGNDLGNFGTDINHLRTTCDENPSCLGFNHNGWEKFAQPELTAAPGNCYYVKVPCDTPPVLVSGEWVDGNGDNTNLEISGCSVKGTWLTNDRVAFSGHSSGTQLTMTFPDDNTFTGIVSEDGTKIEWSNGTTWNHVAE